METKQEKPIKRKKNGEVSHQGEGGGKPSKYTSENLADTILKYFDTCRDSRTLPNKAGLCVFLHVSRDTYNEYKKRYPDAFKAVEDYIENAWVQRLAGNAPTGAIFYLKNAFKEHYKDRIDTDITSGGKPIPLLNAVRNNNSNKETLLSDKKD